MGSPIFSHFYIGTHRGSFHEPVILQRALQALVVPYCEHMPSFFLLFTGFILKGDKEGISAGFVVYNLLGKIPLLGQHFRNLFLHPGRGFFILPYLHHVLILPVGFVALLSPAHSWRPQKGSMIKALTLVLLASITLPFPVDINPALNVSHVRGPWFFWGIQETLRYAPPLLGGIVFPVLFAGLFCILPLFSGLYEKFARSIIYLFISAYVVLCIIFRLRW